MSRLEPASQRLLPLVYRNLRGCSAGDSTLAALQTTYLKTWSRNRIRFLTLAKLLNRLAEAGLSPLMLLKGGALIRLAYCDYGARSMADFDLLVRYEEAPKAMQCFRDWGWQPSLGHPERLIPIRNGDEFRAPDGQRLDLHWNLFHECCGPGASEDIWDAAVNCDLEGAAVFTPGFADLLLHVIVHGARWSPAQPLAWTSDAIVLIRAAKESVDWDRLLEQTRRRRLMAPVQGALRYLSIRCGTSIPVRVVEELSRAKVTCTERLEHIVKVSPRLLVGTLPVLWFDYARLIEAQPRMRRTIGFITYLQLVFRCDSIPRLVVEVARLVVRRVHAYLGAHAKRLLPQSRSGGCAV